MSLGSYSELKAEIIDHLDRSDLDEKVDTFIALAEARHKREIRIREMVTRSQATINTTTGRYLALPSGFIQMQTLRLILASNRDQRLLEVNLDEMTRLSSPDRGIPQYFVTHEEIEFDRPPDQSYTVEMVYWKAFTPLSDDNESNPLLVKAPDAYLYGALSASAPFIQEDERIEVWERYYGVARDGLLVSDRRSRYGGPLVSRVSGPTP